MAIVVEHEKRKKEILEKSFELFIEEGYEDVTFQKIADRCGITRTTLYIYFKNKREIFSFSIKQLTNDVERQLMEIIKEPNLHSIDCLKKIFFKIFDIEEKNSKFFKVLKMYLMQLEKGGVDINERIRKRVIRIIHLMSTIIIRGQKKGEIKNVSVKEMNDLFYALLESGIFRLGVLNQVSLDQMRSIVDFTVEQFRI
ncbi:MAG: TetR/AcrR family transcriptional regulator [Treponema sp.]|nr:TetR/AcrR family transcriptional regulator [Spirochaetia bacterium]MDD7459296.1 TetR/AcrR family transcriptional regulator [Spirochaetales bacterium]MDY5811294.1 TetR/AcrR family transcriptional regulator [Treponema sp.]MEE1181947.1 TetR/AcrR family transcriptional regulator [Treponema sp.]